MADLTVYDQLMLELVNRARLDPNAEAARQGISLNSGLAAGTLNGAAKQPLAGNLKLNTSASNHSLWMLATDKFSHTGSGGSDPGGRMGAAGYSFTGSWTWGENIAWTGTTGTVNAAVLSAELHNNLFHSPGHRENILNGAYREIGVGIEKGVFTDEGTPYNALMGTQNFATSGSSVFVTGVAIRDTDGDNFYDIGEGRSGIHISLSNSGGAAGSGNTAIAGGYSIATQGGTLKVTFSGGGLTHSVSAYIAAGTQNAKVDLVDSSEILSSATTTLGVGAAKLALLGIRAINGYGNDSANVLIGNAGANTLSGRGGNDVISGGSGRDVMSGGTGSDRFDFNRPSETSASATGRDRITDFVSGVDDIDVSTIDAKTTVGGYQAFTWIGTAAFSGAAGQLRYVKTDVAGAANDKVTVYGDVNGDRTADFSIELTGIRAVTSGDFIL